MKKLLIAGLVAASAVFAQGAMADHVMGKITQLSVVSLSPSQTGYIAQFDTNQPGWYAPSTFETDCDGGFMGYILATYTNSPAAAEMLDLMKSAVEQDLNVNISYEKIPSEHCQIISVAIGR